MDGTKKKTPFLLWGAQAGKNTEGGRGGRESGINLIKTRRPGKQQQLSGMISSLGRAVKDTSIQGGRGKPPSSDYREKALKEGLQASKEIQLLHKEKKENYRSLRIRKALKAASL